MLSTGCTSRPDSEKGVGLGEEGDLTRAHPGAVGSSEGLAAAVTACARDSLSGGMEITATTILALIATVLGVVVGYFAGVGSYAAAGGTAAALAACFGGLLYALIKENAHRSVRVADDSDVENPKSGVSDDAKHKEKPRKQSVQKEPRTSAIKQPRRLR